MHKSAGHEYITKQKKTGEIKWKQENRRWRQNRKQIPTTLSFFESGSVFAAPIFCPPTSTFTALMRCSQPTRHWSFLTTVALSPHQNEHQLAAGVTSAPKSYTPVWGARLRSVIQMIMHNQALVISHHSGIIPSSE